MARHRKDEGNTIISGGGEPNLGGDMFPVTPPIEPGEVLDLQAPAIPRPLADLVIIRRADLMKRTAGGLWLPEPIAEDVGRRVEKGTVVKVGRGRQHPRTGHIYPPEVKEGDVVLYSQALAAKDVLGDETLVIVPEAEIIAVFGPAQS